MVSGVSVSTRQMDALQVDTKFESRQTESRQNLKAPLRHMTMQAATVDIRAMRELDLPAEPHTRRSIPG